LNLFDRGVAEKFLQARQNDVRGAGYLAGPLRARGVHEQDVAFEAHGRHALHRNADGRLPREIHLAERQRGRAEQLRERARESIANRLHLEP
jgi:hypothetical protein